MTELIKANALPDGNYPQAPHKSAVQLVHTTTPPLPHKPLAVPTRWLCCTPPIGSASHTQVTLLCPSDSLEIVLDSEHGLPLNSFYSNNFPLILLRSVVEVLCPHALQLKDSIHMLTQRLAACRPVWQAHIQCCWRVHHVCWSHQCHD